MNDMRSLLTDHAQAMANWSNPAWVEALNKLKGEQDDIYKSLNAGTATAGFQTPLEGADGAGVSSNSPFSPLVPQSLDELVGNLDFRPEHLAFFNWLPKKDVKNTLIDWGTFVTNGDNWLDGALAEGELGSNDSSTVKKGSAKIKSYSNRREITDIANTVSLMNTPQPMVSTSQLETLTKAGMLQMHKNMEMDALHADGAEQVYKLNGVCAQLKAASQYDNLDGATVSMEYFEDKIRDLTSAPYYARPTHIFVPPKIYTSLSQQQNPMLRRAPDGKPVIYGIQEGGLKLTVGSTTVAIEELKFLDERNTMIPPLPATGKGKSASAMLLPAMATAVGVDAASKFVAGDVGVYKYAAVVVTADGSYKASNYVAAPCSETSVAGSRIRLTLTCNDTYDGGYWVILRAAKGVAASQKAFEIIGRKAIPVGNGAANVIFDDNNLVRNGTYKCLILRQDPEEIVLYQLIKLFRTPLAKVSMTQPFALFTACGLQVKVPEHQWLLENVAP